MNLTRLSMVAAAGLLAACSTAPTVEPPAASQPPASSPAAAPARDAPTAAGEPTQGEGHAAVRQHRDVARRRVDHGVEADAVQAVGVRRGRDEGTEVCGRRGDVEEREQGARRGDERVPAGHVGRRRGRAVFDGERSALPSSRVMPGKSLKWRQAFGQPGDDITITADWSFQGPVTFQ